MYRYKSKRFSLKDLEEIMHKSQHGDSDSQYLLANYYDDGLWIDEEPILQQDKKEAFDLTEAAYRNGSKQAMISYANYLSVGYACDKNEALAKKLYKEAIKANDCLGAFNLDRLYTTNGKYKKAFEFYHLADNMGKYCALEIGTCYYYGIGTKQDIKRAICYYKSILRLEKYYSAYEFEEANYILAKLYLEGIHLPRSLSKARKLLNMANIDRDHRSAQNIQAMLKNSHNSY